MATPRIQSVDRAFSLLTCLAREKDSSRSLPAMAAECGLTIATAHRLLATLETLGAVVHTSPGRYRIGMGLIELARGAGQEDLLTAVAEPTLRRITRDLSPTAHLGVLDSEFMVTYLAKSAQRSHKVPTLAGSKLEAYCSGLGKVLLAALDEDERGRYLAEGPFVRLTRRTIVEPAAIDQELNLVRQRGYAVDNCELFENLRCVAVPIYDHDNEVVAALSASYPQDQLPMAKIREVAFLMQGHAKIISAKLFPMHGLRTPCRAPSLALLEPVPL
jgi:IclR family acetate operon transcriptional repressor